MVKKWPKSIIKNYLNNLVLSIWLDFKKGRLVVDGDLKSKLSRVKDKRYVHKLIVKINL
jgi:hypothetical protein